MLVVVHPDVVDRRWPWGAAGVATSLVVLAVPPAVVVAQTRGVAAVHVGDALIGAVVPAVGALVLSRSRERVGWVLLATVGLALGFAASTWSEAGSGLVGDGVASWARWLSNIVWVPFLGLLTLLPLWFPHGALPSRRWRPVQWLVVTLLAAVVLAHATAPRLADGSANPLAPFVLPESAAALPRAITTATVASSVLCVGAVVARFVRGSEEERRPLRWFAVAVATAALIVFLPGVPIPVADVLIGLAFVLVAAAIAAAVLGRGLYGIDLWVNRTLVLAVGAALTFLVHLVAVAAVGSFLPSAAAFVGIVTAAVVFAPLRSAADRAVDRVLNGARTDPLTALAALDEELAGARPGGEVEAALRTIRESLRIPRAALRSVDGVLTVDGVGAPAGGATVIVELDDRGALLGVLELTLRPRERALDARDVALVDALARGVVASLRSGALARELQAARERLVAAREEERRRLHHDLHDGLGPTLSHAVLALDGARAAGAATREISAVKESLQEAVGDLRRLVQGLRPPALDDLGLGGALDRHSRLTTIGGPAVEVVVDPLPPMPAAVEVAAYRIATEALANCVRHAGARVCRVHIGLVESSRQTLEVEIHDDGVGFDPGAEAAGVGLTSMRQRAEELGGDLEIRGRGDGTVVLATLPLVTTAGGPEDRD